MLSMAVANHVLWPLAKFVNAKLVPKQHQPVANKVVQVHSSSIHSLLSKLARLVLIHSASLHIFIATVASQYVTCRLTRHMHLVSVLARLVLGSDACRYKL